MVNIPFTFDLPTRLVPSIRTLAPMIVSPVLALLIVPVIVPKDWALRPAELNITNTNAVSCFIINANVKSTELQYRLNKKLFIC